MELFLNMINAPEGSFNYSVLIRIIIALICGGVLGLERGLKGRPAGLKTFSLVCVGATLVMVTNEYITMKVGGTGDAARMAAQVISGIGFLGAGTIIVTGTNQVKGLTTAASLWVNAAIGIAVGAEFYFGAIVGTFFVCFATALFKWIDTIVVNNALNMRLCVEGTNEEFIHRLLELLASYNIHVKNLMRTSEYKWYKKDVCVIMELELKKKYHHAELLKEIENLEGCRFAEEI